MSLHSLRFATVVSSFALLLVSTASGQNVLRTHDGAFNSDQSSADFAYALDFIGDVDADGVGDYVIGAPSAQPGGEVYVYSGRTGALLRTLQAEGAGHAFGADVARAGDFDGDGVADLLVVAPTAPQAAYLSNDGVIYLYSGATGALLQRIQGVNREGIDHACAIGDVDGDGLPDLLATTFVFGVAHGYSSRSGTELWSLEEHGLESFQGPIAPLDDVDGDGVDDVCAVAFTVFGPLGVGVYSGVDGKQIRFHDLTAVPQSLASIPDVDGDGMREILVGSPGETNATGAVYVYSGTSGALLLTLNGPASNGHFGLQVADAGDVNGDGVREIAVTSQPNSTRTHALVQLFRVDTGTLVASIPSDFYFGDDLAGGSDLDGDGRSELLVGDRFDSDGSTWHGRAWIYRGDDLYLFANQAWFASGDSLVLDSRQGIPGQLASMWLLDVNSIPIALRLAMGTYDGAGSFAISGTVPPGLAGIDLGLIAFGLDPAGHLHRSARTDVEFR